MYNNDTELQEVDTLPITDQQWLQMVDGMDQQARSSGSRASNKRRHERLTFREKAQMTVVRLENPSGTMDAFRLRLRNLSTGGIGFLHGHHVFDGTPCMLALPDKHGHSYMISGRIVRCRKLKKDVFEVGVQFDEELDLNNFKA